MAKDQNLEVWENPTDSLVSLHKLDHRGVSYDVLVLPHRRVNLTPEERDMNEGLMASDELNPFRNGLLRPIRLIASPEDGTEATVTANAKSDAELLEILKKTPAALAKVLVEIDSPITVRRFIKLAEENDATVKQIEALKNRLEVVDPNHAKVNVKEVLDTGIQV